MAKNYPSPLLSSATMAHFPEGAAPAAPSAAPRYLAETRDYGVEIIEVRNENVRAGWQRMYHIVHKQHEISAAEARTLGFAISLMEAAQQDLDKATGKSEQSVGGH